MNYTIFDNTTGKILKTVTTNNIATQLGINESYIDGVYDDSLYYIQNGIPIEIPTKPNQHSIFNWQTRQWDIELSSTKYFIVKSRNRLLAECDWTQFTDVTLSSETKNAWVTYRQELRDITIQPGFPLDVVWPTKPE